MTDKRRLVIMPSMSMDENKKEDRNEHGLIRLPKSTRESLGLNQSTVSLSTDKSKADKQLDIFHAFSSDVKAIRSALKNKELHINDVGNVGFVTTSTYRSIFGKSSEAKPREVWLNEFIERLLLGADPEFLLFNNEDRVVHANSIMHKEGVLGSDGAMAEIRPNPASEPEELVSNIKNIFLNKQITNPIKDLKWISECYHKDDVRDYPVGGHIHIGNLKEMEALPEDKRRLFFCTINKIFDELLAIPMIKFDGKEKGSSRRVNCKTTLTGKSGYGYFGEWRPCNGHFEYRTLSGRWLCHPTFATIIIGVAKAIVEEIIKYSSEHKFDVEYVFNTSLLGKDMWCHNFNSWKHIPLAVDMGCTQSSAYMRNMLHQSDDAAINKELVDDWYNKLKSFSSYNNNSDYIDALYELLSYDSLNMDEYRVINKSWLEDNKFIIEL